MLEIDLANQTLLVSLRVEYDSVAIVYNRFVSAISYEPAIVEVETELALKESGMFFVDFRVSLVLLTWVSA